MSLFERMSVIAREGRKPKMQLFTVIEDVPVIVRVKGGVFKQCKLYHRDKRLYVGISGGFVRVEAKFGETNGTSNPNITVIDIEPSYLIDFGRPGKPPQFKG
jgi:hypothetical protein